MGDTTNWEFAAAVAAVVLGLGGLLLFTIIGNAGSERQLRDLDGILRRLEDNLTRVAAAVNDIESKAPRGG